MTNSKEYLDQILGELRDGRNQWRRGDRLLAAFGYTRRRQTAIDLINRELSQRNMFTTPELSTEMPLDRAIRFHLQGATSDTVAMPLTADAGQAIDVVEVASPDGKDGHDVQTVTVIAEPPVADLANPADRALIIGNFECAERVPEQINPTATVMEALTIMDLRDYSQLVVTTGPRSIKGLISYKSIARARLHRSPEIVADCIDTTVPSVERNESLLRVVELFNEHDAVLVISRDRRLAGIVTPADVAVEFRAMAGPFLLIGQLEDQLRWLVRTNLDVTEATEIRDPGTEHRPVVTADDLTMGELQRILEKPANWEKIGIQYDRRTFCAEMNAVREVRNAVMHFRDSPDASQLKRVGDFAAVVQKAYLALTC